MDANRMAALVEISDFEVERPASVLVDSDVGDIDELCDELATKNALLEELKDALDVDKNGNLSTAEISAGIAMLKRVKSAQAANSAEIDYSILPESIREVMKTWDVDGTGTVSYTELAQAAKIWSDLKRDYRILKRVTVVLAVVVLVMLAGVFGLSFWAVQLAKDMHTSGDGTLKTTDGQVVQVASSEFIVGPDGTLKMRAKSDEGGRLLSDGDEDAPSTLKTSLSETKRRLSSTMATDTYKELKSVTLVDDEKGVSLGLPIQGFRRTQLRTSKCGSVVRLETLHGELTIDDFDIFADARLQKHVISVGLGDILQGKSLKAFGRRLSAASMLTGFFNTLGTSTWECKSQPLEAPEELEGNFRLKARVRELMDDPAEGLSRVFEDLGDDTEPVLVAGIQQEGRDLYKVWEEDVVDVNGLQATVAHFPMSPLWQHVTIQARHGSNLKLSMLVEGGAALRCKKQGTENHTGNLSDGESDMVLGVKIVDHELTKGLNLSTADETAEEVRTNVTRPRLLRFVDLVEEDGMLLRHFEMDLRNLSRQSGLEGSNITNAMDAGVLADISEYYDVDTDPTGRYEPGSPYRRVSRSREGSSRVYLESTYWTVTSLDGDFDEKDLFNLLNITNVSAECAESLDLSIDGLGMDGNESEDPLDNSSRRTEEVSPNKSAEVKTTDLGEYSLLDTLEALPPYTPDGMLPVMPGGPWMELGEAVEHQRKHLEALGRKSDAVKSAMKWKYWRMILVDERVDSKEILASYVVHDDDPETNSTNETEDTNETDATTALTTSPMPRRLQKHDVVEGLHNEESGIDEGLELELSENLEDERSSMSEVSDGSRKETAWHCPARTKQAQFLPAAGSRGQAGRRLSPVRIKASSKGLDMKWTAGRFKLHAKLQLNSQKELESVSISARGKRQHITCTPIGCMKISGGGDLGFDASGNQRGSGVWAQFHWGLPWKLDFNLARMTVNAKITPPGNVLRKNTWCFWGCRRRTPKDFYLEKKSSASLDEIAMRVTMNLGTEMLTGFLKSLVKLLPFNIGGNLWAEINFSPSTSSYTRSDNTFAYKKYVKKSYDRWLTQIRAGARLWVKIKVPGWKWKSCCAKTFWPFGRRRSQICTKCYGYIVWNDKTVYDFDKSATLFSFYAP